LTPEAMAKNVPSIWTLMVLIGLVVNPWFASNRKKSEKIFVADLPLMKESFHSTATRLLF